MLVTFDGEGTLTVSAQGWNLYLHDFAPGASEGPGCHAPADRYLWLSLGGKRVTLQWTQGSGGRGGHLYSGELQVSLRHAEAAFLADIFAGRRVVSPGEAIDLDSLAFTSLPIIGPGETPPASALVLDNEEAGHAA